MIFFQVLNLREEELYLKFLESFRKYPINSVVEVRILGLTMINSLYILNDSGTCTDKIELQDVISGGSSCQSDPQLLSGLFTALISFAELTTGHSDALNYLPLNNLIFYFHKENEQYYILETEGEQNSMGIEDYRDILREIAKKHVSESICSEIKTIISKYIRRSLFKKTSNLVATG